MSELLFLATLIHKIHFGSEYIWGIDGLGSIIFKLSLFCVEIYEIRSA